jgi:hypothetical protein
MWYIGGGVDLVRENVVESMDERLLFFSNDNRADGELTTTFNRGWMLTGAPSVTGGGSTMLIIKRAGCIWYAV